jgi:hypothetical protein
MSSDYRKNKSPNYNKNRSHDRSGGQGQGQGQGHRYRPNQKWRGRGKRRPYNPNYSKGHSNRFPNKIEDLLKKYNNLLDQHIEARTRYFDFYNRGDLNLRNKLERAFIHTLEQVRKFESTIHEADKKEFEKRISGGTLDITYSNNRAKDNLNLENDMGELPTNEFNQKEEPELGNLPEIMEDPHLLQSQIEQSFQNDTEESYGTIEDYLAYKGQ